MILFADTSAFVKLYIEEAGSSAMELRSRSSRMAASALAYAELHAALARRLRESLLTEEEHDELTKRFEYDWQGVVVLALRPALVARVPRLVRDHPLRGADAVHLASALTLEEAGLDLVFAAADTRLIEAAEKEGLESFDPQAAGA